ncbi:hypothetical protein FRC09_019775 [Ceratobasidium sp. 395]|nr:hypothetical protein FRC09_019775 [Ceratobasidium sp. 395]
MYHLAQHLIHMTAGPAHLAKYMHNSPHSQQDDHPVGIISWVLKDKFAGKPSNFPHKIVLVLWQHLQELTADLSKAKILVASETSKSDYKALINNSKPWWELLRMFKMSKLPGMDLIIPKVFAKDLPPPNGQLLQAIRNKHQITNGSQNQPSSTNGLGVEHSDATGSRAHSSSLTVEQPQPSTTQLKDPSAEASSAAASGNQSRVPHVAKRKQANSSEEEEELRPPKGSRTLKDNDTTAMTETESPTVSTILDSVGRRQIQKAMQQQLKQLSNIVSDLDAGDAKAMHQLLSNLLEMRGASYLGRVVGALSEKTPMLVERAKKAEKSSQEAEMDWELSETLEQVDAQL